MAQSATRSATANLLMEETSRHVNGRDDGSGRVRDALRAGRRPAGRPASSVHPAAARRTGAASGAAGPARRMRRPPRQTGVVGDASPRASTMPARRRSRSGARPGCRRRTRRSRVGNSPSRTPVERERAASRSNGARESTWSYQCAGRGRAEALHERQPPDRGRADVAAWRVRSRTSAQVSPTECPHVARATAVACAGRKRA